MSDMISQEDIRTMRRLLRKTEEARLGLEQAKAKVRNDLMMSHFTVDVHGMIPVEEVRKFLGLDENAL